MTCPFWSGKPCDDCPTTGAANTNCTLCGHTELPACCKTCDFYYPDKGCSVSDEIKDWEARR